MKPLVAGFLPFLHASLQLRMPADGFAEGVPMLVQDTTIPIKEVRYPLMVASNTGWENAQSRSTMRGAILLKISTV